MSTDDSSKRPPTRRRRRSLRVPVDEVPRPTQSAEIDLAAAYAGSSTVEMPAYQDDPPIEAVRDTLDEVDSEDDDLLEATPTVVAVSPFEGADSEGAPATRPAASDSESVEISISETDGIADEDRPGDDAAPAADPSASVAASLAYTDAADDDIITSWADAPDLETGELDGDDSREVVQAASQDVGVGVVVQRVVSVISAPGAVAPPPDPDEPDTTDTEPGTEVAVELEISSDGEPLDDESLEADALDEEPALDDEAPLDQAPLDEDVAELDVDLVTPSSPPPPPRDAVDEPVLPDRKKKRNSKPPPPPGGKAHAPPPPPERKVKPAGVPAGERKKKPRKKWWEELFSDDYLRTVPIPLPKTILRQCDFIEERLGLPRGSTILDVGCGLGLHAVELTKRGYLVVGLDLSLPMLSRAADEAQEHGFKINFLHADMRSMNFDGAFDAVMCWGTTFGYFDDDTNKQVIEALYRALRPRGLLLLDVVNRDHVIRNQPNLVWFEGDGCVVMEETQMNYITSRLDVKRTVILDDGRQRDSIYSIRLYSLHELGKLLHQQGFRVVEVSGRQAHPAVFFGADSPQLIVLAERRPPSGMRSPSGELAAVEPRAPRTIPPPENDEPEPEAAPEPESVDTNDEPSPDVSAALAEALEQSEPPDELELPDPDED